MGGGGRGGRVTSQLFPECMPGRVKQSSAVQHARLEGRGRGRHPGLSYLNCNVPSRQPTLVTGPKKTTLIALLRKFFFVVEQKDYVCATVCTLFEQRSTFCCGVITANAKLFPQRTIVENCI